jgi:hypothetical protein
MDVASSNTLTIPRKSTAFFADSGDCLIALNKGAGITTLTAGPGVTINSLPGLVSMGQWALFGAWCLTDDTWIGFGSLTT